VVATGVAHRRDGRLVRLDVTRQDQHDVPVVDRLDHVRVGDILHAGVEVLVAERLDPALVAIEDEHVLAAAGQVLRDGVPDAPATEDRVSRSRRSGYPTTHCP